MHSYCYRSGSCVARYAVALIGVKLHTISAKIAMKFMHARGAMACIVGVYTPVYTTLL
jgi:hypothetical protein